MIGFSKLASTIVTSSIWVEDDKVLRVWIAMLATCDAQGVVHASIPGFAHLAMVSTEEMVRVLGILKSPDPFSRSTEFEGRRVKDYPGGGWVIINYGKYRNGDGTLPMTNAERQKRHRERQRFNQVMGEDDGLEKS